MIKALDFTPWTVYFVTIDIGFDYGFLTGK